MAKSQCVWQNLCGLSAWFIPFTDSLLCTSACLGVFGLLVGVRTSVRLMFVRLSKRRLFLFE
jgi:hypothetical protein